MLKIEIEADDTTTTLRLEGQVIGPWVAELDRLCGDILDRGGALRLDLGTVSFVSHDGARLLRGLRARRATLANCSGLVAEQLRSGR